MTVLIVSKLAARAAEVVAAKRCAACEGCRRPLCRNEAPAPAPKHRHHRRSGVGVFLFCSLIAASAFCDAMFDPGVTDDVLGDADMALVCRAYERYISPAEALAFVAGLPIVPDDL
jgi:hypothetical protein